MKLSVAGTALQTTRRFDPSDIEQVAVQLTGLDTLVGVGSLPVPDRANADEWYSGRRVVILDGPSDVLRLEGYITSQTRDRPTGAVLGRQAGLQVGDANELLHHRRADKYKRPAETDVARVLAFAASTMFADLALDTSWVLDEFTVDLPEKTYDGDDVISDLAGEVAEWAGKTLFLHIAWDGTTRVPHLHYHRLNDRGHAVGYALTDVQADINGTTVLSMRAETVHRNGDGFELYNDVLARANSAELTVNVSDATSKTLHDADGVKHETVYDADAADLTELTALANNLLLGHKGERYSYTATTQYLTAAQAAKLSGGALITVTSKVWALTAVTMRIANVNLRPKLQGDGTFLWAADLELDRPIRRAKPPIGKPDKGKCKDVAGATLTDPDPKWWWRPKASPGTFNSDVAGTVGFSYATHQLHDIGDVCASIDHHNDAFYGLKFAAPREHRHWMSFDTSGVAKADCGPKGATLRVMLDVTDCACGPYELVSHAANPSSMSRAKWDQGKFISIIDLSRATDGDKAQGWLEIEVPDKAITYGGITRLAIRPKASWSKSAGCPVACTGTSNPPVCCCPTCGVGDTNDCGDFGTGHHQLQPCNVHSAQVSQFRHVDDPQLIINSGGKTGCLTEWEDARCAAAGTGCTPAQVAANHLGCDDPCLVAYWSVPCGKYKPGTLQVMCGGRVLKRGKDFSEATNRKCFKLKVPCTETPKVRYIRA